VYKRRHATKTILRQTGGAGTSVTISFIRGRKADTCAKPYTPANMPMYRSAMRVLLFTSIFPTPSTPVRGIYSAYRFAALGRHCDVRAIAPLPWWTFLGATGNWIRMRQEIVHGIQTTYLPYPGIPGLPPLHAKAMAWAFARLIRRMQSDFPVDAILAAWAYPDAAAAALVARRLDVPLVTMVLGSDINTIAQNPALRQATSWGLQQADCVISVSQALRSRVIDLGVAPNRVLVQHNGVDGNRFTIADRQAARARLGLSSHGRLVCYVGNLVQEKGVDLLPLAIRHIQDAIPDIKLAIVGDGDRASQLRDTVRQLGLSATVRFYGKRRHTEVPDWIAASDVLVLPSRREGCPNVILEALASGRPVVAANVGGVPELLSEQSGILVSPDDPIALGAGLRAALDRDWDPVALRQCVTSLSWDDYGAALNRSVLAAIDARRIHKPSFTGASVSLRTPTSPAPERTP
jgi:glycosyltransferase involved in cell wall biosynthesis